MAGWVAVAGLLLVRGTATSSRADDNRDCLIDGEVLRSIDAEQVFAACRRLAREGDAVAQFNLGVMYQNGQGAPRDLSEAARWFRKAADQGYVDAEFNLGILLSGGQGVPRDYVQAYMWFSLAAQRDDASAENRDALARLMTPVQIARGKALVAAWKPTTGP